MKKAETAPVGGEASAQVLPAGDFMHCLVLNELFEHDRRRAPVDALEFQKAAVEPRTEQMREVRIDGRQLRRRFQLARQPPAHIDQCGGGARRDVQPAEQFLARRFDGALQINQRLRGLRF
jgi:hypothetical protein